MPGYQDGNALAGPLSDVFVFDITATVSTCSACGRRDQVATLRVYGGEPGFVARCPGCDSIVLRYARTPAGHWLDLRGTISLHAPADLTQQESTEALR
jgi:hypothetical protein